MGKKENRKVKKKEEEMKKYVEKDSTWKIVNIPWKKG